MMITVNIMMVKRVMIMVMVVPKTIRLREGEEKDEEVAERGRG